MTRKSEERIIDSFRRKIKEDNITEDVKVIYRIVGGMPSERVEEEFRISGEGKVVTKVHDALKKNRSKEATGKFSKNKTRLIFEKIGLVIDKLVPRSEGNFPFDSVIGSIGIEVNGKRVTYFFSVDEDEKPTDRRFIPKEARKTIREIEDYKRKLLLR